MTTPPPHTPPDEFVRVPEAEKIAKQSYSTLLRRARAGHDVGIRRRGRIVLVHVPTLVEFLRSQSVPTTDR